MILAKHSGIGAAATVEEYARQVYWTWADTSANDPQAREKVLYDAFAVSTFDSKKLAQQLVVVGVPLSQVESAHASYQLDVETAREAAAAKGLKKVEPIFGWKAIIGTVAVIGVVGIGIMLIKNKSK